MKKFHFIFTIIFATITCFIFAGCEKYPDTSCPCGKIEVSKKEYISMCFIPDVVTENSVNKLRMENYTQKRMQFGSFFCLEYFNDNSWEHVDLYDLAFTDKYAGVTSGTAEESDWTFLYQFVEKYNNGKKGKYRIIKNIDLYEKKSMNVHSLIAEFEIK
jgi:hypothetical protein